MVGPSTVVALLASTALLVAGCTSTPGSEPSSSPTPSVATSSEPPSAPPSQPAAADSGPVEAFRTWLAASREPDTDTACGMMTDALVERMIAELAATGVSVSDCAEMISSTAALYSGLGIGAEVDITVQEETEDSATLFVVYAADGDCGTAVLQHDADGWVINELSQECAAAE